MRQQHFNKLKTISSLFSPLLLCPQGLKEGNEELKLVGDFPVFFFPSEQAASAKRNSS